MLLRRGLALEYVTLAWNVVGTFVLVLAAAAAGSVALAGFGVDSLIEIVASAVVVWQLKGDADIDRERRALRIIAIAFAALSVYIAIQTVVILSSGTHPGHSVLGIVWLVLTVVAMFVLAAGKRSTGQRLGNPVLSTEARVTLIDGALAAAVLTGVVLNAAVGWWWADPLSAFVILLLRAPRGATRLARPPGPSTDPLSHVKNPRASTATDTGARLPSEKTPSDLVQPGQADSLTREQVRTFLSGLFDERNADRDAELRRGAKIRW